MVDCCGAHEVFVKKVPITLYRRLIIAGEHEMMFSRGSLFCYTVVSSIAGANDVLTSNHSQQPAQLLQLHNKAFETLP